MKFPYIPRGDGEEAAMLHAIGVPSFEHLVAQVPEELRLKAPLSLPPAKSELEVIRYFADLAGQNKVGPGYRVFLGGGAYDHMVPTAVDHVSFRSEYYTAYTPYQPEVAQGTLTTIFEFQTMMAELTGMDLANASLYDGASALAEAVLMAAAIKKTPRVLVAGVLHPHYLQVLNTLCAGQGIEVVCENPEGGNVDPKWAEEHLRQKSAALVLQSPNFFGLVEDGTSLFRLAKDSGALAISVFEPHSLALYKTPGEMGADLAVGEGRSLGSPLQYGGPALGLFAASGDYVRYIPGRLIGETVDRNGKRAYVMTLQTREQHIRRARATSNICTNQGLFALRATIYLSLMGPQGLTGVAEQCLERAHYLAQGVQGLDGYSLAYDGPFFQEFVVRCPVPVADIQHAADGVQIIPGIDLGMFKKEWKNLMLVCCSERHTKEDLDSWLHVLAEVREAAHV